MQVDSNIYMAMTFILEDVEAAMVEHPLFLKFLHITQADLYQLFTLHVKSIARETFDAKAHLPGWIREYIHEQMKCVRALS